MAGTFDPRGSGAKLGIAAAIIRTRSRRPVAVIRGQDRSRWTDFYHGVLTAPWWLFFLGLAAVFLGVNGIFALLYAADPHGIAHARPGNFFDAFFFSVQTLGSIGYGAMYPVTLYANTLVTLESFSAIVNLAIATGLVFARISRPTARVLFSDVAIVTAFDGTPTLMFRAANQRGNQILNASVVVTFAHEAVTREGIAMRRFEELKLVRAKTPLFALSWTVMHRIDDTSPLYGATQDALVHRQVELIALLSGTDDTLSETIYARHSYRPHQIRWNHRFVDVLCVDPRGRRVVDLRRFHDTEPEAAISAP
ncbi:MAG: ATP-sensitive inward rectifier potassium channel 10 [Alphaproteobacteria bacterium]|nr:ATP-sensitive inward rectifier potassium channel 10 [Alphaproteobacteria bacterium]MDE2111587.1 ATP-sensitive inward rectifier potassium channel 10 [Alphaproteobacteria bacterium]MDE2495741.1 ATP-sensitive inward rectifier potassium channel 10 [Alphaproteobacteria bacterium]